MDYSYDLVSRNTELAQKRQKLYYDQKTWGPSYAVGDAVMLYTPVVKKGCCRKLTRFWSGPFVIKKVIKNSVFRIRKVGGRKCQVVHYNRLKRYGSNKSDLWKESVGVHDDDTGNGYEGSDGGGVSTATDDTSVRAKGIGGSLSTATDGLANVPGGASFLGGGGLIRVNPEVGARGSSARQESLPPTCEITPVPDIEVGFTEPGQNMPIQEAGPAHPDIAMGAPLEATTVSESLPSQTTRVGRRTRCPDRFGDFVT